jgi:hypothetical protein
MQAIVPAVSPSRNSVGEKDIVSSVKLTNLMPHSVPVRQSLDVEKRKCSLMTVGAQKDIVFGTVKSFPCFCVSSGPPNFRRSRLACLSPDISACYAAKHSISSIRVELLPSSYPKFIVRRLISKISILSAIMIC